MSKTITKVDIVEYLHRELGLNKSECKNIVEDFFQEIKNSLVNNEEVKLSGFGNFEILNKNARPGRNPKTGEDVTIKARRVVTFRAGNKLRKKIASFDG
jgi:integration host factor subunit alpha|tara:strand:- start:3208 stop:3504 length:297 start_codon:yes stop_codon:yes gene_type:complete